MSLVSINRFLLFLLATVAGPVTLSAQPPAYDTLYIFDHHSWGTVRSWGRQPLRLRFPSGDTLVLDATNKKRQALLFDFETWRIPPFDHPTGEGVRIIFHKGTALCLQAASAEEAGSYSFRLDTFFCVNSITPKPWVFWNSIRREKSGGLFKPDNYTLTNFEWAYRNNYRRRRTRRALRQVRYEYNTITGVLTDNRQPKKQ